MRIAQISDVHFTRLNWNPLRFCSKRALGMINWVLFRKSGVLPETLNSLPQLFSTLKVDLLLVGGDLTSTSLPSEFLAARQFFDKILCRKLYIPGNHDQYTNGSHRTKRFYETFKNKRREINHPAEFFTLSEHGVEAHQIQEGWWCVALDTAPPTHLASSNGVFFPEVEKHLEEVLDLVGPKEKILVLNHFPFFQNDLPQHRLIRGEALRASLERRTNILLYLHGHSHRHTIADLQPNNLPLILDAGCPVQKEPMASWNLIDLTDKGCEVQAYRFGKEGWEIFEKKDVTWTR